MLVAGSLSHSRYIERDVENLIRIGRSVDKPVVFCGYTRADPYAVELLARAGFPCTTSMANAAKAIRAMNEYREFLERIDGAKPLPVRTEEALVRALSGARTSAGADIGTGATMKESAPQTDEAWAGEMPRDGLPGSPRHDPDAIAQNLAQIKGSRPLKELAAGTGSGPGAVLCEHDTKTLLSAHGIGGIPAGGLALDAGQAVSIAGEIGGPVAMKVQSEDLPHKSESNGIALGVEGETAVRGTFERIMENARAFAPSAIIKGVRVERMAEAGVEMIIGVSRDPDFGPMLAVGLGGVLVEVLDDVVLSPAPVDAAEAAEMLRALRGRRILDGVRGGPPADVDALVGLLVVVSEFAAATGGALETLDLNPVIVHPRGQGVSVVDAGIVTGAACWSGKPREST